MEKVSLSKGNSGNWTIHYKASNIVNPDLMKKPSKSESPVFIPKVEKTSRGSEPIGEKDHFDEAERLRRQFAQAEKRLTDELSSREGVPLQVEWKSEAHQMSMEISKEAYEEFGKNSDSKL